MVAVATSSLARCGAWGAADVTGALGAKGYLTGLAVVVSGGECEGFVVVCLQ